MREVVRKRHEREIAWEYHYALGGILVGFCFSLVILIESIFVSAPNATGTILALLLSGLFVGGGLHSRWKQIPRSLDLHDVSDPLPVSWKRATIRSLGKGAEFRLENATDTHLELRYQPIKLGAAYLILFFPRENEYYFSLRESPYRAPGANYYDFGKRRRRVDEVETLLRRALNDYRQGKPI